MANREQMIEEFQASIDIEALAKDWYWKQYNKEASGYMGTYFRAEISADYDDDEASDFANEADYRLSVIRTGEGAW